jgi:integrase
LVFQTLSEGYSTTIPAATRGDSSGSGHSLVTPFLGTASMPTLKLRQDTVRSIPYQGPGGKHQCVYWDAALEAFGLRVYPSGRRVYVCSYRVNRRKRLATLGRADVLTLDQARRKAITYLGKVAGHEDPQDEVDRQLELKRVDELCEAFVEGHSKKKKKTWKADKSTLDRNVLPKLGSRLAQTITSADIEPIHAEIGVAHPYAANRLLETVRKMFNWGKVAGFVPQGLVSPIAGIVRFRERKRKRFITTVEMPRFLEALEQEQNDYARHGIWLLLLTGLRSTELLNAKWEHIDWEVGALFIGLTKNGEPLLAPLSEAAMVHLKVIPRIANNPYIICGQKPGQHMRGLGAALRRVLKRTGLENVRVHDLRRTVGSWLAQSGKSLHLIGDVLNHRDTTTTAGYAYFQTQQRRDALTGHGEQVLSLGGPQLQLLSPPQTVSAANLLPIEDVAQAFPANAQAVRYRHYFKRETLYELVWTAPVMEVARRLGVSDVAVAKLCRRANIPVPGRGYWARVEAGQQIPRTPLPSPPDGLPELLRIRGTVEANVDQVARAQAA